MAEYNMRQFKLLSLSQEFLKERKHLTLKTQPAFILYIYMSCDWWLVKWNHQTGVTLHYWVVKILTLIWSKECVNHMVKWLNSLGFVQVSQIIHMAHIAPSVIGATPQFIIVIEMILFRITTYISLIVGMVFFPFQWTRWCMLSIISFRLVLFSFFINTTKSSSFCFKLV